MSTRFRIVLALPALAAPLLGVCALAGCAQIFGIDDAHEVAPPEADGGADATRLADGGKHDATKDGAGDGSTPEAAVGADAGDGAVDSSHPSDAPVTCAEQVAALLNAPINPPFWGGLDLSNGGIQNIPGNGGLTIQATKLAPCAGYTEPSLLGQNVQPLTPGYRATNFGTPDAGATSSNFAFSLNSNISTGVIETAIAGNGYKGTFKFHSRANGVYGNHTYEVAIGASAPASADGGPSRVATGGGYVKRDGEDFPADWTSPTSDAGRLQASPWANEIYDGIMATYSPGTAHVDDCRTAPSTFFEGVVETYSSDSCLYLPAGGNSVAYLGIRPVAIYMTFNPGTNQVNSMYGVWRGGFPDCTDPANAAQLEQMNYGGVYYQSLANVTLPDHASNPSGLTKQEVGEYLCNGVAETMDGGAYGALAFGPSGEVILEYNKSSGLAYQLSAVNSAYRGTFSFVDGVGRTDTMTIGEVISAVTYADGGAAVDAGVFTVDWPTSHLTTPTAATVISNDVCEVTDQDCVDAGDCIVSYDSANNMTIGTTCGLPSAVAGVVFGSESSIPSQFFVTNPNAQ